MVQWINILRNNSFVNPMRLPLLCEKTGALAIVEPRLTAVWQAGMEIYGFCKKHTWINSIVMVLPKKLAIHLLVQLYQC